MRYSITALLSFLITLTLSAQAIDSSIAGKVLSDNTPISLASVVDELETDFNIDIIFYHLDIDIDIDHEYIEGSVYIELTPTQSTTNKITLNLDESLEVTQVSENASEWSHSDRILEIQLDKNYIVGELVKVRINYEGEPALLNTGTNKGLRFDSRDGVPAIATLSTPYLAHYWFPCKDGPTDKANSVQIDITIPDESYGGYPLIAVSNGLPTGITENGDTKTFHWRHNYPIVPYYMMIAVSNYQTIERTYNRNGHNFPLTYYVFPDSYSTAGSTTQYFYEAFDAFIHYYGDYPFKDEKYGMTQIALDWAIENQPNAIVGNVSSSGYETMVHELAHMWFGASITNQTWNHIWLNEGFANYSEALFLEYTEDIDEYHDHLGTMTERFTDEPLYMADDSDPARVFLSRFYHKGAWVLHMLRGYLGDERFFNCIKTYAQNPEFKYKSATTEQFRDHCENISGVDLNTFFDQWVYGVSYPVYNYNYASFPEEGKVGLTIYQSQQDSPGQKDYFEMYIPLRLRFADGTSATERIFNNRKTQTFYFDYNKELSSVTIDPEEWIIRSVRLNRAVEVPTLPKITSFTITNQIGQTLIDHENSTILVTVPNSVNLSALTPTITTSANASVSPASGFTTDFTSPVVYTVTNSTGTQKAYTVTVKQEISSENKILQFNIPDQIGVTSIDHNAKTVEVTIAFGATRTALTPVVEVSADATVEPSPGSTLDFTNPVIYTVTAEDGTIAVYNVTVTNQLGTGNQITAFVFPGQEQPTIIDQDTRTISIVMPYGTNRAHLTPTITLSDSATISPASGVERDFTNTVNYTVKAENGDTRIYSVSVTNEKNIENYILSFSITGQLGQTIINNETQTIELTMPYGTDRTELIPTIAISPAATIIPEPMVETDFSAPVEYTVTAENGNTRTYTVTVTNLKNHANEITGFTFSNQNGESVIDTINNTVHITMPYGSDLSSLTPSITVSEGASVSPVSGETNDFTIPVIYTVTAENGTVSTYTIIVDVKLNDQNQIETFAIDGQSSSTQIDHEAHTVFIKMPYGSSLSNLTPNITISGGASILPASGIPQDFTAPVHYTVTAQDGTQAEYTITVSNEKNNENSILSFNIPGQVSTSIDDNKTVEVLMPFRTDRTALIPVIEISEAASLNPSSGTPQNFTKPVLYTVTAENGDVQTYTVIVNNKPGTGNLITAFTVPNQIGSSVINNTNNTIQTKVDFGISLLSLEPAIVVSDSATISPASGVANNFSTAVNYTVTAENGDTRIYSVTVTNELNDENRITAFTIDGQVGETVIDQVNQTINLVMPYGISRTSLIPHIVISPAASVSPPSGEAHSFENPVEYTVSAENGNNRVYRVSVTNALNHQNQILTFSLPNQIESRIDYINHIVEVLMPYGTNRSSLIPTILVSPGAIISPASGITKDFSSPVEYVVTAENNDAQMYTVIVTNQLNNENFIKSFNIPNQAGLTSIDNLNNIIRITMPYGISRSSLTPVIETSLDATVTPASGTPVDFTSNVVYTVEAENGDTREYNVIVTNEKNNENEILEFSFPGQDVSSIINHNENSIEVTMPFGTMRDGLVPTITLSEGASITPLSGVAQDFTRPVIYTVIAENGDTWLYEVTVDNESNKENRILSFNIAGQAQNPIIDQEEQTISIVMPYGTNRSSLIPVIVISDSATVNPQSGAAKNFLNPVNYTVTAENGDTRTYTVTVTNEKNVQNQITGFYIPGQILTTINHDKRTINVIMPALTNRAFLTPVIEVSPAATVNPESGTTLDFTEPVLYTVTAENGDQGTYTVTVTNEKNNENLITAFSFPDQKHASINQEEQSISVLMPFNTDRSSLSPTITVSTKASVSPASGVAQNFVNPRLYTVTAENGDQRNYSVTVTNEKNDQNLATSFYIPGQLSAVINHEAGTIDVLMMYGTDRTTLTPAIGVSPAATIDPPSGIMQDFTDIVSYTVTAENGNTRTYSVTVTNEKNDENLITAFNISGQIESVINQQEQTIEVLMPFGTNLKNLAPVVEISDAATVIPSSGATRDFTQVVEYKVTAENWDYRIYRVMVTNQKNDQNQVTAFNIPGQVSSVIDQNEQTIEVLMPFGTDRSSLSPIIELSPAASVNPASGISRNFTSSVTYTVEAENGDSRIYTVTVTNQKNDQNLITAFNIPGQISSIIDQNEQTIEVLMPFGADRTILAPVIEVSPAASVNPASGIARNFTSSVTYTVEAENGDSRIYTVTVFIQKNDQNQITAFSIPGQVSSVIDQNNQTINVLMPYGSNRSNLSPVIEISPAAMVNPASGTTQNFSNIVTYVVKAENGNTRTYSVAVTNQKNDQNLITAFSISGQLNSEIDQVNQTIQVLMPYGTNRTSLAPVIQASPAATVNPATATSQDFTGTVIYTVTAENGLQRTYSVTVTNAYSYENYILSFAISGQIGSTIIDQSKRAIKLTIPYGTNRSALAPVIVISEAATLYPPSGEPQDFTAPFEYFVTAQNGEVRSYMVTVTNDFNDENDILTFRIEGQTNETKIDSEAKSVELKVPYDFHLEALTPMITVSPGATVSPASGEVVDFTDTRIYSVRAENGSYKDWRVSVTKEIPSFLTSAEKRLVLAHPNPTLYTTEITANFPMKIIDVYMLNGLWMKTYQCNGSDRITIPLTELGYGVFLIKITSLEGDVKMIKVIALDK